MKQFLLIEWVLLLHCDLVADVFFLSFYRGNFQGDQENGSSSLRGFLNQNHLFVVLVFWGELVQFSLFRLSVTLGLLEILGKHSHVLLGGIHFPLQRSLLLDSLKDLREGLQVHFLLRAGVDVLHFDQSLVVMIEGLEDVDFQVCLDLLLGVDWNFVLRLEQLGDYLQVDELLSSSPEKQLEHYFPVNILESKGQLNGIGLIFLEILFECLLHHLEVLLFLKLSQVLYVEVVVLSGGLGFEFVENQKPVLGIDLTESFFVTKVLHQKHLWGLVGHLGIFYFFFEHLHHLDEVD